MYFVQKRFCIKYFFWPKMLNFAKNVFFLQKKYFGKNIGQKFFCPNFFSPKYIFVNHNYFLPIIFFFAKYIFFAVLNILIPLISCRGGGLRSLSASSLVIK